MPKSYSGDLRERVIEAVELGASRREAAERFEVSVSSAVKWLQRWRESGSAAPKPRGGSVSPLEEHKARVLAVIAGQPDLTLVETVTELRKQRIRTSRSSLWRFLDRHGITFKKSLQAAERQRADVARARRRWIREQGMLDRARLVFIDETAASTNMVRLRGRARRGVRLIGRAPFGAWETITFVAALRHNQMTAPMVINGAMSGETFLAYVEQCLVPTPTKSQASERQSRPRGRPFATCRSTRPTSIRSRCPTANLKLCCASLRCRPSPVSAEQSAHS